MKLIFENIFKKGMWGRGETSSGVGSTMSVTSSLRNYFIQNHNFKVCNIPCGDMNWMKSIYDLFDKYYGIDIVSDICKLNKDRFKNDKAIFACGDICTIDFKDIDVDIIFSRDCLVHFCLSDIIAALQNITISNAKYLMMTHFTGDRKFRDISTGDWRPINFCKEPFLFSEPEEVINEGCLEGNGAFSDKTISKWKIEDIRKCLQLMKK